MLDTASQCTLVGLCMHNTLLSTFFVSVLVPFTNICLRFVNQKEKKNQKDTLIKNDSTTQAERIKVLCYCITNIRSVFLQFHSYKGGSTVC